MYKLIDGKYWAKVHEDALRQKLDGLQKKPVLVSFLIGDDPASILYTDLKQKKATELGIDFRIAKYAEDINFDEVARQINKLNASWVVHGIMIQLPLPKRFLGQQKEEDLINLIKIDKDVDGLRKDSSYLAATVRAIFSLLNDEKIDLVDKKVVVVGAKGEVGSRAVKALEEKRLEVIGVDNETTSLVEFTKEADVLISSTGKMHIIKGNMIKGGAVVIDVGSEKLSDGRVVGDVDFESVAPKASYITPVPGGVGPMTVISLMENVVESAYGFHG